MNISQALKQLNLILGEPLYIVGGFVRNFIAGFGQTDIDLASSLTPSEIIHRLKSTKFKIRPINPRIGTLKIYTDDECFEYTTFRIDNYPNTGEHEPTSVKFTTSLDEDAQRRDFTLNAIYYDIKNDKIIDPVSGIQDINNRIIRTVREPQVTFEEDALRLLRLVRIAAQTGYDIDSTTLIGAKDKVALIESITKERIRCELESMLVADTKYGIDKAHYRALLLADQVGLLDYIIPDLVLAKGLPQPREYHEYDVFNHILHTVEFATPKVRLAALLHDIGKPSRYLNTGKYSKHDVEGAQIARRILNELKYPQETINRVSNLVSVHMFDSRETASVTELRLFVSKHANIIDDLIELEKADALGSGNKRNFDRRIQRLSTIRDEMIKNGSPFKISDLLVSGRELIELNIPEKFRGTILKETLKECIEKQIVERDAQIEVVKSKIALLDA
ncbi:MAG: CCA tRNA nucleotidyltransferase [Christensenellaceae bacterium]|jgi:tRNA nucleotidyltransferase (CCA-adding enzyme)|nr:CCA tRNA nucleotidyltransferase [Christensenellaceae bacterium]